MGALGLVVSVPSAFLAKRDLENSPIPIRMMVGLWGLGGFALRASGFTMPKSRCARTLLTSLWQCIS